MSMIKFLSKRGAANVKDLPMLVHAHFSTLSDQFDRQTNPNGYINMGTAENRLIDADMIDLLSKIQCRMKLEPKNIHYELFHGSKEFRTAIANYWQNVFLGKDSARKLDADNIAVSCGCSLVLEMLAIAFCDPGDVVLIPRPFYPGFVHDIEARAHVIPVGVECGVELSKEAFESALAEQKKLGKRVRAVLFSSPNNPTGYVYPKEAVQNVIEFCMENDLEVFADEIYAQTIYDPKAHWVSALKLVPEEYKHRVHVTSGFAKDFALSGFRVGFCHSYNKYAIQCMQELTYFAAVSTHTQAILREVLLAPELPDILKNSRESLLRTYKKVKGILDNAGIPSHPAQGGIFLMADYSKYLSEHTYEAEGKLWEYIFKELKINISPGRLFEAAPGTFRMCFAHPDDFIEEVGNRLPKLKKQ